MSVSSLFDSALQAVMRDFHHHEAALRYLPSGVKSRVAGVMAKRGLMNERNMSLVSLNIYVSISSMPHYHLAPSRARPLNSHGATVRLTGGGLNSHGLLSLSMTDLPINTTGGFNRFSER